MSFPSKPISYAKAVPSNYRKTLRHSCLEFLCDQHILRRVLQCCFWVLQSQESPGDPQHASCHSWVPPSPSPCGSPSLGAASGILQDLFPACSHSTLHQKPNSGSSSAEYGQIGSYSACACAVVGTSSKEHQTQCCSHVDHPPGYNHFRWSLKAFPQLCRTGGSCQSIGL